MWDEIKNAKKLTTEIVAPNCAKRVVVALCVAAVAPILLTLGGATVTKVVLVSALVNFCFAHAVFKVTLRSLLPSVLRDAIIFAVGAVLFGQPWSILWSRVFDTLCWALYCASSVKLATNQVVGFGVTCGGIVLFSPLLVLDWMRWWQNWPIPAILGVAAADLALVLYYLFLMY